MSLEEIKAHRDRLLVENQELKRVVRKCRTFLIDWFGTSKPEPCIGGDTIEVPLKGDVKELVDLMDGKA
jgi:hypothetical protein